MRFFDAHGDILTDVMEQNRQGVDIWEQFHASKYKQAPIGASIFVNFTYPYGETQKEDFAEINNVSLDYFKNHPNINVIDKYSDFKEDKFNLIFGIEGMKAIDSVDQVQELYGLGYRHIGITWNEENNFASGVMHVGGLKPEGKKLIEFCNTHGVIVDFAHFNRQSFFEAAKVTTKPIFFSHGNVYSICDHVRNLDRQQLELVRDTNGVIGLSVIDAFLNNQPSKASIDDLIAHIIWMRDNIGIDHVGFGFDFCYYLGNHQGVNTVSGLEHISDVSKVIDLMKAAGLAADEIEKVCYGNMMRVIKEHLE